MGLTSSARRVMDSVSTVSSWRNQAGTATVTHVNKHTFDLVAIKQRKLAPEMSSSNLRATSHDNIVGLQKIYSNGTDILLLYNNVGNMHVSLANIPGPSESLIKTEIAAMCKQE
ncbi:hypothetical protein CIHG_10258 [Coccidioides immitis H538.4]|uniref:Protein kinase domain-containing protein n=1 Tax=Coccidioides immitis H538.4 TaxID=396776 RepID=A0A0J8UWY0_COCIT|nr:hypothetical protein CIHG_10258 [Coccidioides immitis H538.4]